MNEIIFIKSGNYDIDNLKKILDNYISNYNLNKKYKKYVENNIDYNNEILDKNKINIEEFEIIDEFNKFNGFNEIKESESELQVELQIEKEELQDWSDCDDILAYNEAYKEVMYIKNDCKIMKTLYNYIWKDKIKYKENKFIKNECKTKQEHLFYKYYEELLCTEL